MSKLQCFICYKCYDHLGSHIPKAHKITAREYKHEFGLDYKFPLISESVKRKKQIAFDENKEYYLKNLLEAGKKYRFKKGHTSLNRLSEQSRTRITGQLDQINGHRYAKCPVCNIGFDHMESHLYNKHGLLIALK